MRTTIFAIKITIISNNVYKFICCKINPKNAYNNLENR